MEVTAEILSYQNWGFELSLLSTHC